jgi:2-aminoadipate transaminase
MKIEDSDFNEQSTLSEPSLLVSKRAQLAHGQPIGELMHQALAYPDLISLAAGFVDSETLPVEIAKEALLELASDTSDLRRSLQYGSNQGDPRLRDSIIQFSYRHHPPAQPIHIEQTILTAGSNQLLHLIAEALFNPGDIVLTAVPTYFVFLGTLKNLGVRTIGIASDHQGMQPDALAWTLENLEKQGLASRVKSVYLIPYFDNPGSTTLPEERRRAIAEHIIHWRHRHGPTLTLLADYAYQELGFTDESVPPWRSLDACYNDFTLEAGTFSKSFSPGVRIGWGILPQWMMPTVSSIKANIDFGSPNFNQRLMARVLESNRLPLHLSAIRSAYAMKCNAMLNACDEFLADIPGVRWQRPKGGLYVWLDLPPELPTGPGTAIYRRAIENGVLYVPGEYCFPLEGERIRQNSMRLTFGVQSQERIREGIRLLGEAIRGSATP